VRAASVDPAACVPDLTRPLRLPGLEGRAEVWRDPEGVPHVHASSTHDAFFAQGLVHAQDRLWHMEHDRRRAYGRLAEWVGPSAVPQDVHVRRLRLAVSARADYAGVNAETRAMLDAYAAGVNALLAATKTLPLEFRLLQLEPERWEPWDSLAVFKVRHVEMGAWHAKLWRARLLRHLGPALTAYLCPGTQPNPLLVVPPGVESEGPPPDGLAILEAAAPLLAEVGDPGGGSNNWALAGTRTASGRPLVAGDPHRALDVPNVYYPNHVACPEFDAIGFSFPGVPGLPHFGHNQAVCWCVTHAMADYQDLFVERFDRADPRRYLFQGEWRTAEVHRETVHVKGGAPVEIEVTVTHHGPVALGDPGAGHALAFRYTATAEPNRTAEALLPMLRARSADELEAAMRPWVDPVNNFVLADSLGRRGTIGYRTRGQVPVRQAANAWLPVPGWDGAHEWQGVIPFEEMPALRDPETGWIATANSRITGDDYRHYLGLDVAPDFRTRRVVARLRDLTEATAADMAAIHADRLSIPAGDLVAALRGIAPTGPAARDALDRLLAWDGRMERDQVAPTIYAATRERLVRDVLTPLFGPLAAEAFDELPSAPITHTARLKARLGDWIRADDRTVLPPDTDWPAALSRALDGALDDLTRTLGADMETWRWERVHVTRPRHPLSAVFPEWAGRLDPPAVAVGGDGETVQATGFVPAAGYGVTAASVARYVFDLGDWERSAWIVPLGVSGHPASPHYADQATDWADVRLRPMRYGWNRVRAEAESHQVLQPRQPRQARGGVRRRGR
jgi:penicillin G amidase